MYLRVLILIILSLIIFSCSSSTESESKYNPPEDHTISKDGVKHKPGLSNPTENCVSCHGADLRGSDIAPSCYTCHGKEW